MVFYGGSAEYIEPGGESNAESIARHLPDGTFLVAAFKTIPAHVLADLDVLLDCDVFVCSDSEPASQAVMAAARLIPSLRPVDGGPLRTARTLERMAVLAVNLNRRYREKRARFRVQGI
jgi:NADPH-dependent F420 reductase